MERYHRVCSARLAGGRNAVILRACCRCIPFNRQPLWNSASVSSHQDVLEASHCASLTANLRQLAGVVSHAAQTFEKINGQVSNAQAERDW